MLRQKNLAQSGFSLIELIVVIAILTLVFGISVRYYIDYINKARVSAAFGTLSALEQTAKEQFEDSSAATSISYGGVTFPNGTVTALDIPPVVNASYVPPGGNGSVNSSSFLVCVYVGKLRFTGYVAPTAGVAGSYSRLCKLVTAQGKIYTSRCGSYNASSGDIPTTYLPTGCSCANVSTGSC